MEGEDRRLGWDSEARVVGSTGDVNDERGPCIILELGVVVVDRGDKVRESRRRRRDVPVGGFGVEMDRGEIDGPVLVEWSKFAVDADKTGGGRELGLEIDCMKRRVLDWLGEGVDGLWAGDGMLLFLDGD